MGENKTTLRPFLSDALIMGFLTAISYVLTYIYESQYCSFFGIPDCFINLSLISIITVVIILLVSIFFLMGLYNNPWLKSFHAWEKLSILLFILNAILFLMMLGRKSWPMIVLMVLGVLIIVVSKKIKSKTVEDSPNFLFYIFIIIGILFGLSNGLGYIAASKQGEFLVTSTTPEMLVIKKYDNNLICIPFNREKKEANRRFMIIETTSRPEIMYRLEKVGPIEMID